MSLHESISSNFKYLTAGTSGTLLTIFSHSMKEWNEIGQAIGIWVGVTVGILTIIKILSDMIMGEKIRKNDNQKRS